MDLWTVDGEVVDFLKEATLPSLIEDYKPEDIFNVDESGFS